MSGICGCIHYTGRPGKDDAVAEMAEAAAYRGPDGTEIWTGTHASLAYLAHDVTPADERESQPLIQPPHVLVADARIDNRSALQSKV